MSGNDEPTTASGGNTGGRDCEWQEEKAGRDAGCAAGGGAPAPAGLPCPDSNNSTKKPKRYRLRRRVVGPVEIVPTDRPGMPTLPSRVPELAHLQAIGNTLVEVRGGSVELVDDYDRVWDEREDGDTLTCWGGAVGPEQRAAFDLKRNLEAFIDYFGIDHCLFFTVTPCRDLTPGEFAKCWNSYLTHEGAWIRGFIKVLEPQKRGRPHYHLVVAVEWDVGREKFDWKAFLMAQDAYKGKVWAAFRELRAQYKASAVPQLVEKWAELRGLAKAGKYALGRTELVPIRDQTGVAEYVGKYLAAGFLIRKHSWKGCRRVEYDRRSVRSWRKCTRVFAWVSPAAQRWRRRVGELGAAIRVSDFAGLQIRLGKKWTYLLGDTIRNANDVMWANFLVSLEPKRKTKGIRQALLAPGSRRK